MYVVVQDSKRIRAAQKLFVKRLHEVLPQRPETFTIGYKGGNFNVSNLRSNGLIWFAHHVDTQSTIQRNWNGFGMATQLVLRGSNKIVVEANVALDGQFRRTGAVFVEDSKTDTPLLLHRGKIGGGKKGVGKSAFLRWFQGPQVEYTESARSKELDNAPLVADLGARDIARQVGEFITAVHNFKAKKDNEEIEGLSDTALTKKAKEAPPIPKTIATSGTSFARNPHVSEYAKRRANGFCDLCKKKAPFKTSDDRVYLECHHIEWLAHRGTDTIENTVALCPNCHRKMHIVKNLRDIKRLRSRARQRL